MNFWVKASFVFCIKVTVLYTSLQTLIVFGFLPPTYWYVVGSYALGLLFIPFFSFVAYDYFMRQREKYKAFTEKLDAIDRSSLVATFSPDGTILDINENLGFLLGYKSHELAGKPHSTLVPPKMAASREYQNFWSNLSKGTFSEGLYERIGKDGDSVWVSSCYVPIKDKNGEVYEIIKIAQDVTERVHSQMELVKQNAYLEHAAKILRHDMHSGINTYMPRGLRSLRRRLSEKQVAELKIESPIRLIEEGLTHTQKVYRGVYEFTNLVKPNAALKTEIVNIGQSLSSYLSSTAYSDQVAIDRLPMLKVNEPLFCTAIDNMIRNGLKYNDSEFKMVAVTMIDDSHLAVIDNGRGMTSAEFEDYSKPYLRKKGQAESGTGLGLNISLAILKEHGFTVTCHHDPHEEQGTTIRIKVR